MSSLLFVCVAMLLNPVAGLSLTLKYFNARGAAEISRVLLALGSPDSGNKIYEDVRYEIGPGFQSEEFKAEKESGALMMNLNRAPLLLVEGEGVLGQSKAIERFLAERFGLMGSTPFERATIDMVSEHVRDVKDAQRAKRFSAFVRDKDEEQKAQDKDEWFSQDLPGWLERIEMCVAECKEVICGETPSYAAVCIWSLLREGSAEEVELVTKAAAACPVLNSVADAVAENPKVAAWVESRPATMF